MIQYNPLHWLGGIPFQQGELWDDPWTHQVWVLKTHLEPITCKLTVQGASSQVWFLCRASSSSHMTAFHPGCDNTKRMLCGLRRMSSHGMVIKANLGLCFTICTWIFLNVTQHTSFTYHVIRGSIVGGPLCFNNCCLRWLRAAGAWGIALD